MQGRTLWEAKNNGQNNISIDTKLFAKGIYIVNVKSEKNSAVQKLIVE